MEIFNCKKSAKIFFLALTILFIYLFVSSIRDIILEDFDILAFIISSVFSIFLSIATLITFSSKTILQENGVIYKTIFKSSFHSWNDIKFVAEYEINFRYSQVNGIICSFDLEKDKIKFHYLAGGSTSNKHYFCFPYSEEAINFLLANLPNGKYLGLAFTDESFNKK
ncbi:MAG: hypothetical protein J1E96_03055 [Ruminococcus sp.]|nr:hypothetical protein [Ruminococcus sp.]